MSVILIYFAISNNLQIDSSTLKYTYTLHARIICTSIKTRGASSPTPAQGVRSVRAVWDPCEREHDYISQLAKQPVEPFSRVALVPNQFTSRPLFGVAFPLWHWSRLGKKVGTARGVVKLLQPIPVLRWGSFCFVRWSSLRYILYMQEADWTSGHFVLFSRGCSLLALFIRRQFLGRDRGIWSAWSWERFWSLWYNLWMNQYTRLYCSIYLFVYF